MSPAEVLFDLHPSDYKPHALHGFDRDFRESNCYVDVCIGVLHALGLEPTACLAFTLASEFEGDQWTFFKPPHADLQQLYGLRIDELTPWRPLVDQVRVQLARRRLPVVEVDSYFLPDTAASDYRKQHVKTSIAISHLDPGARTLRYFHNAGFYELAGDDFDGLFRIGAPPRDDYLPPYCEIIKTERARAADAAELRETSAVLARRYLALRPASNPLRAHAEVLSEHLGWIVEGGLPAYHGYSFAVIRQLGANFELAGAYLRWLSESGAVREAADACSQISKVAKMLILKLARVANTRKISDVSASFEEMAQHWDVAMDRLDRGLIGPA
jgi:hypothetical protein